jgi:hypothetical protein
MNPQATIANDASPATARARLGRWPLCLLGAFGLIGCSEAAEGGVQRGSGAQPIIYGEDDRQNIDPSLHGHWAALAHESVVALIESSRLVDNGDRVYFVDAPLLGEALAPPLCPEERFLDEPSAARCGGTLIDSDLVLTAGHCFADSEDCSKIRFVFDYTRDVVNAPEGIPATSVYACRELVARGVVQGGSSGLYDFAVARLESEVDAASRAPVSLRTRRLSLGEPLTVIGYPLGIPAKLDMGVRVRGVPAESTYFWTNTDAFSGSSGAAVFDASAQLAGLVIGGGYDFVIDGARYCLSTRRRPDSSEAPELERVLYSSVAIEELCRLHEELSLCSAQADEEAREQSAVGRRPGGCSLVSLAAHPAREGVGFFLLGLLGWFRLLLRRVGSRCRCPSSSGHCVPPIAASEGSREGRPGPART